MFCTVYDGQSVQSMVDAKRIINWELLAPKQTINANLYCLQMDQPWTKRMSKHPALINGCGILFYQYKTRYHVALRIQQLFLELGWNVLPHQARNPFLTP